MKSVATQTEPSTEAPDHALWFVETKWFATSMLEKIMLLPHYTNFALEDKELLKQRFVKMKAKSAQLIKHRYCVCCRVKGHSIDNCPVRILLTSTFRQDPINKILFGKIKGLQAGWTRSTDAEELAIAKNLLEHIEDEQGRQEKAAEEYREQ